MLSVASSHVWVLHLFVCVSSGHKLLVELESSKSSFQYTMSQLLPFARTDSQNYVHSLSLSLSFYICRVHGRTGRSSSTLSPENRHESYQKRAWVGREEMIDEDRREHVRRKKERERESGGIQGAKVWRMSNAERLLDDPIICLSALYVHFS